MAMGPEDKKKVYAIAALAGLLGIVGLVVWHPWSTSRTGSTTATPSTLTSVGVGQGGAPSALVPATGESGAAGMNGGSGEAGAAGGGGAQAQLVASEQFRDDPFTPFYTKMPTPLPPPPPVPTPRPTATPIPATILPPVESVEPPSTELPEFPGGNSRSTILVGLPATRISRLANAPTTPRVQAPPVTPGGNPGEGAFERSPNKRLAGVAIGDSVRALLEVEDPITGAFRTYIVQPGQRVDAENLQVLRIERTTENNQSRVRMLVRENGQIRVIDLREGQRPDIVTTGGGGEGGYPGSGSSSAGGYPGGGRGGFPGGAFPGGAAGGLTGGGGYPGNAAPPGFPGGRPGFGGPQQN